MANITLATSEKQGFVDITSKISEIVSSSKVRKGLCLVYSSHSTGAIIVNENYDPNIGKDINKCLSELIPDGKWLHDKVDGNGAAHIKASIIGPSESIPIKNGKLRLGRWQSICFCEFDGPRKREVQVVITHAM